MSHSPDTLFKSCISLIKQHKTVWILTDDDGCVMLNTEDEDCVPVWPQEEDAKAWATGDWADCQPKDITLETWLSRWTQGLLDDDLAIAIHPIPDQDGYLVDPEEFADALEKNTHH